MLDGPMAPVLFSGQISAKKSASKQLRGTKLQYLAFAN
jgi:hypothetical protein